MKQAYRAPSDGRFHKWCKRVKDYWYHCRLLRRCWPASMDSRIAELKRRADLLGDDHDLAVLQQTLDSAGDELVGDARRLSCLAAQRQEELRTQARELGHRVYDAPPSAFADEIANHWESWKQG